jgi:ABC-type transport system substrate-binding protein
MVSSSHSNGRAPELNRRRLLQGLAATGVAATAAGCFGGEEEEADPDEATDQEQADLEEIQEGGTLEFALSRQAIGNYDYAQSTQADDSTVLNTVYDFLRVATPSGEYLNWMASSFEVTDAQDVSFPQDYTEYMAEYEIDNVDAETGTATFDLGDSNLVLGRHPDDVAAVANGDLGEGDMMRVLTRNESGDAVDDGTYGTKIEASVHEGITFHNGEELTAGNIIGSYDRVVGSTNEGQQFDSFLHARATDGMDGYDVEFYAVEADAIADTSIQPVFGIFPSEHMDVAPGDLDPRGGGPTPIGTGPYEIDTVEEGRQLVLTRTDNYWLEEVGLDAKEWWDGPDEFPEAPVIDEINVRFQQNASQRVAALRDESIDMAYDLPAEDQTTFQQNEEFSDYRVTAATSTGFQFMQVPVVDGGALSNQEVRQALQQMIPRQQIVETVEDGWATPARLPFPEPAAGPAISGDYGDVGESADWAYPVEAQPDEAESLVNDADVDTPVSLTLETNSDDQPRQQKVQLIAGALDDTDAFEAEVELPAALDPWFVQDLAAGKEDDYAERNATATLGLTAGFDPDGYVRGLHHPDSYQGCCNFFHPPDTFDFIDAVDEARFSLDAVQSVSARQEAYQEVWQNVSETVGNTFIDFSMNVVVAGPAIEGYNAYPDRRDFLTYGLYAPYDELIAYIDRDE